MPITRLDMISMAPKTQEATAFKQQEVQKPVQDQANFQTQMNIQTRQQMTQTTKTSETYKQKKFDAKEKGNGSYSGSGQGKKKQTEEGTLQEQKKNLSSSTFDITI